MKYLPVNEALFTSNRKNFVSRLKPNSIAIFHSNDEYPRNGDQTSFLSKTLTFFTSPVSTRSRVYWFYTPIVLITNTEKYSFKTDKRIDRCLGGA